MKKIQMVDLHGQYLKIKDEIDTAILNCINSTAFINGPEVKNFAAALETYLDVPRVIPCANGTDALQIAMMALDLQPGDEVIVPAFTYVATAEVIGLLKLTPVMVDVDPNTFCVTPEEIEKAISPKTKAIVPVHLFGQCADMDGIMEVAKRHNLYVIEDTAQAIGAVYTSPKTGSQKMAGAIGDFGCTSFFPSKNLGCYGDGGAIYSNNAALADQAALIANHGQSKKYVHKVIGVNSRLDTIQAAILGVKLQFLDKYSAARQQVAARYDTAFSSIEGLQIPVRNNDSTHVFHQYTLLVKDGRRDQLKDYLAENGIPAMVYYPIPLNEQEAFMEIGRISGELKVTKELCNNVISLPIHTEMVEAEQDFIIDHVKKFFK
ncbi:DegT/DnrJ/EryC1/StrS aminotransferase family protein [Chitinophaga sp. Cy-1792]|uniref:DegT/DnrJ/EryC1/StrS family aminotransferase n=1 Tax=Chitinophaga sp. Cy-1792 TaxID=2608339 RepID=UPI00141E8D57|nr:DegT/DnrJ/EryC1/StrS family aminotransferase [Chitinophaga sp. Cy-1792]NIG52094.1 DegT/DnrJ/EryC1/StrS family aminotransferase [Chitinophaga sp. Cy-1792]